MSRIGKMPITVPQGVEVNVAGSEVRVKGPRGSLSVQLMPGISAAMDAGTLTLGRETEERQLRAYHGLNRALLANAVTGVSAGWRKELDIIGIGYRVEKRETSVVFSLGYSHQIEFPIPEGIEIEVDNKANRVAVLGADRQRVGQVAAEIRGLRPPEPYKGKGVRYRGEQVRTKAGKQGGK